VGHGLPSFGNEGVPCRGYQGEIVLRQPDTWPFDRAGVIRANPSPQIAVPEDVNAFASLFCCDAYVRFSYPDPLDIPVIGREDNLESFSKEDID
jgi:hypothetical protein